LIKLNLYFSRSKLRISINQSM